jgi:hypothetical protein
MTTTTIAAAAAAAAAAATITTRESWVDNKRPSLHNDITYHNKMDHPAIVPWSTTTTATTTRQSCINNGTGSLSTEHRGPLSILKGHSFRSFVN